MVAVENPGLWEKYSIKVSDSAGNIYKARPKFHEDPEPRLSTACSVSCTPVGSLTPPSPKMG